MKLNDFAAKAMEFITGKKMKLPLILGLGGILLILFSRGFSDDKASPQSADYENMSVACAQAYARDAEKRLSEILCTIEGVGKAEIMVSAECTEETVFAEDGSSSRESGEDGSSSQQKSEHVIIRNGSGSSPLVKKVICPRLSGVLVACEGGDRAAVRDAVTRSVSALFGISSAKIYVARLEPEK